ncbi:MAG: hypothetical protein ACIAQZ_07515 [Sedimentisphaeraceae bacterium JB056]
MRNFLLLMTVLVSVFSVVPNLHADAYLVDSNTLKWGIGPDPDNQPDGQLWYTFSDWDWYEGSLALDSAWPGDPNTQPWPSTFEAPTYGMQIRADATIDGSLVQPTGYVFDLSSAGITGKVISSIEIINAFWNFPSGANAAVAATFYDEDDNRVYQENPALMSAGWWQGTVVDFSENPTKTVRFSLDPYASSWVWSGNYMYIEQLVINLIDEADANCGTKYNPYPLADIDGDCIVDSADVAKIAEYWLGCNDPADAACVQ